MDAPGPPPPPPPVLTSIPPYALMPNDHTRCAEPDNKKLLEKINRIISYDVFADREREACTVDILLHLTLPVLQEGPSCGFAALATIGQLLATCDYSSTDSFAVMLEWAKEQKFTRMGEMFSASAMQEILRRFFTCDTRSHELNTGESGLENACKEIVGAVAANCVILIPYDKGPNHDPVFRSGHSAHWCVVLGLVKISSQVTALSHATKAARDAQKLESRSETLYVLCRHGKSAHVAVWKLSDLVSSCLALKEMRPGRDSEESEYVVRDRNDLKDLRGQIIIVHTESKPWIHSYIFNEFDCTGAP